MEFDLTEAQRRDQALVGNIAEYALGLREDRWTECRDIKV